MSRNMTITLSDGEDEREIFFEMDEAEDLDSITEQIENALDI